jgi:hypothetical protein
MMKYWEKPLWVTEYGSLLPPIDPPGGPNYYNVSDQDTANFMLATFDFMLSATDELTGLPADDNKLVQRWFWYSMNGHRYIFGGTLLNPDYGKVPTLVGEEFIEYQSLDLAQPDLFPVSLMATPVSYTPDRTRVNYRLNLTIGNGITADTSAGALVWIYNGDPDAGGVLIAGPITAEVIQRCGGRGVESAAWLGVMPLTEYNLYVVVSPLGVVDSDPSNNQGQFSVFTDLPKLHFVPLIHR